MFPAYGLREHPAGENVDRRERHPRVAQAWWEDPVALGSLLILLPPVGLAALWSSARYGKDARWALTVMTALTMCLATAIVVAVLVIR